MVFNSGWSRRDIESLTYKELVEYIKEYYYLDAEKLFEFFKAFAINNVESTAVGMHGKKSDMNKYAASIKKRKFKVSLEEDGGHSEHFDSQFDED